MFRARGLQEVVTRVLMSIFRRLKMKDAAQDAFGEGQGEGFAGFGAGIWIGSAAGDGQDQGLYRECLLTTALKYRTIICVERVFAALCGEICKLLGESRKGKPQPYAER
jgi:hypothetical protein